MYSQLFFKTDCPEVTVEAAGARAKLVPLKSLAWSTLDRPLFAFVVFPNMSPPAMAPALGAAGKEYKRESGIARVAGAGTAGIAELIVFHPVDTIAKRLMSNATRVRNRVHQLLLDSFVLTFVFPGHVCLCAEQCHLQTIRLRPRLLKIHLPLPWSGLRCRLQSLSKSVQIWRCSVRA